MKSKTEKFKSVFTLAVVFFLVVAMIFQIFTNNWVSLFFTFLILLLVLSPYLIEKRFNIDIPEELEIVGVFLAYFSLYLGEIRGYYVKIWWWDVFLHGTASLAFGLIGFTVLLVLYKKGRVGRNPFWISIFAFSFAIAIGTVWEIFEFLMDSIFDLTMQKSGLVDTMWDLIIDSVGALISSAIGYLSLKYKHGPFSKTFNHYLKE